MQAKPNSLYEQILTRMTPSRGTKAPRASAAVVPWRTPAAGGVEVFWVRRSPELRFMGGWYAFPGGTLGRGDAEIEVAGCPAGTAPGLASAAEPEADPELPPDLVPGLVACALRELFEETGLLLATDVPDLQIAAAARRRLLDGEVGFQALLAEHRWPLTAAELVFAGRWMTPPLAPLRFDNRFFLLRWERHHSQQPEIVPGELAAGEWIAPAEALARWRRGEVLMAPPIVHILKVLAEDGPEDGLGRLRDPAETHLGPLRRVEFRPGVVLLPLRTPTLPPATHTNAFLLGTGEAVLVDPATPLADEQARLRRALAAFAAGGQRISAIWLTHHHPDHVGAVEELRRELGVPVLAHPDSAAPLARCGIRLDGELVDGQRVELAGEPPFPVRVLHTPGHTRGHLCFFDESGGSLLAGDLVSALSTIVIDPPEGDMEAYLRSLGRMIELAPRTLFPAHGPVILDAVGKLEEYRAHRLERERQVLAAWRAGRRSAAEMVGEIYAEVPRHLHPVAERQVGAHLERLRGLGELE